MSESRDMLREEFQDKEYRQTYAEDFLNTKIATQIRVLREQRGWTQAELADMIGTKQAGVSRLENVNYSGWKIETLKKIARAFDVVFNAGFESFGKLLDEAEEFSREALEKPSFEHDPDWHEREEASAIMEATVTTSTDSLWTVSYGWTTTVSSSPSVGLDISQLSTISVGNFSLQSREAFGVPTIIQHHRDETISKFMSITEMKLRGEIRFDRGETGNARRAA
jgi:transcriptional regulator with XRE-family HTH domain